VLRQAVALAVELLQNEFSLVQSIRDDLTPQCLDSADRDVVCVELVGDQDCVHVASREVFEDVFGSASKSALAKLRGTYHLPPDQIPESKVEFLSISFLSHSKSPLELHGQEHGGDLYCILSLPPLKMRLELLHCRSQDLEGDHLLHEVLSLHDPDVGCNQLDFPVTISVPLMKAVHSIPVLGFLSNLALQRCSLPSTLVLLDLFVL